MNDLKAARKMTFVLVSHDPRRDRPCVRTHRADAPGRSRGRARPGGPLSAAVRSGTSAGIRTEGVHPVFVGTGRKSRPIIGSEGPWAARGSAASVSFPRSNHL